MMIKLKKVERIIKTSEKMLYVFIKKSPISFASHIKLSNSARWKELYDAFTLTLGVPYN